MSYLQFLLFFIVVPTVLMLALHGRVNLRSLLAVCAVTATVAVIYTTPWDHFLIEMDVWNYGNGRVIGTFWSIPYEEYAFFVLQVFFTGTLTALVLRRRWWKD